MTIHNSAGVRLTKSAALALTTPVTADPVIQVNENIYASVRHDGTPWPGQGRELLFPAGRLVKTSDFTKHFPDAAITSVTPATGPAAGGTPITIKGSDFTPGATVTVGGTAATSVVVVDDKTITCVTPAKAAGAQAVAVTTDAGTATKAGGFTTT
ncbi:IPT/TIG domain-containing protein (plasmid) [Streptosporangium sandarakinum]|uniref:IPT/TIG domain-containing protein n=1 Tax=Streptosporangium sandarakinum TaxID=1260955 RepID=UPI003D94DB05